MVFAEYASESISHHFNWEDIACNRHFRVQRHRLLDNPVTRTVATSVRQYRGNDPSAQYPYRIRLIGHPKYVLAYAMTQQEILEDWAILQKALPVENVDSIDWQSFLQTLGRKQTVQRSRGEQSFGSDENEISRTNEPSRPLQRSTSRSMVISNDVPVTIPRQKTQDGEISRESTSLYRSKSNISSKTQKESAIQLGSYLLTIRNRALSPPLDILPSSAYGLPIVIPILWWFGMFWMVIPIAIGCWVSCIFAIPSRSQLTDGKCLASAEYMEHALLNLLSTLSKQTFWVRLALFVLIFVFISLFQSILGTLSLVVVFAVGLFTGSSLAVDPPAVNIVEDRRSPRPASPSVRRVPSPLEHTEEHQALPSPLPPTTTYEPIESNETVPKLTRTSSLRTDSRRSLALTNKRRSESFRSTSQPQVKAEPYSPGYLGSLTKEQEDVLRRFRQRSLRECPHLAECFRIPESEIDRQCLRWLRMQKWNEQAALEALRKAVQWRDDFQGIGVNNITEDMCKSELSKGKMVFAGHSLTGLPVFWFLPHLHIRGQAPQKEVELAAIYALERLITPKLQKHLSGPRGENMAFVADLAKLSSRNLDKDGLKFLAETFRDYYPETLGVALVVDSPWIFKSVWIMIKGLLDPVTVSKIQFISRQELSEYLPPEAILTI